MVRILHFSDFHYKKDNASDFKNLAQKLSESIKGKSIDFIVFSGDLVFKDYGYDAYKTVYEFLFKPILKNCGLNEERLLIVPGNHDMQRDDELGVIKNSLALISTNEELEDFCKSNEQVKLSMNRFKNYNKFIHDKFGKIANVTKFYTTFVREINSKKYGFVALNSSWRCYESTKDRGNLLFPLSQVREAFSKLDGCELVFCTMHHNLSDFKDFVAHDIEDVIHDKTHVLFTGHYHKMGVQTVSTSDIGIVHSIAPATYNRGDKTSQYGYCVLDIDEDTYDMKETPYYYVNGEFVQGTVRCLSVPMSEEKKQVNDFRKLIRRKINEAVLKADDLFVYGKSNDEYQTFANLFKEPIIKDKSVQEIITSRHDGKRISLQEMLHSEKSTIIFGHDKCGKTSLLYKFLIDTLKDYSKTQILPLYIDFKKTYKEKKNWNIKDGLRQYYELNKRETSELITKNKILLLIDDINLHDVTFINEFLDQLQECSSVRFIACTEETMSSQCALINFRDNDILKYYIHDITVNEVHQLTCSWPNIAKERRQMIEEQIIHIFSQMHIPFNFWTTSLFLWILERTDESNIHNNFELINLYVDEILGKKDFVFNSDITVDYDDLKSFLSSLAKFIFLHGYQVSESELFEFTKQYHESHKKFTIDILGVINLLRDKNIITNINEDKTLAPAYTFRLKGIFEYFLAYKMKDDTNFRDDILNDRSYFFGFGNEIELYAGFQKKDIATIEKVFSIVQDILSPITQKAGYHDLDSQINSCLDVKPINFEIVGNLIERISTMPNDDENDTQLLLMPSDTIVTDDTQVVPKQRIHNYELTSGNVEKALFILARVYRNSKVCDDEVRSNEILNFVLDGVSNLGFMLVDDAKNVDFNVDEITTKNIIQLVSNYMPIIIEAFLYDAISQKNLSRVFSDKLEELTSSPEGNEFRIFLLTLVLVDLDIKENLEVLNNNLQYLKLRPLRFAVVSKLLLLTIQHSDNLYLKEKIKVLVNGLKNDFEGLKQLNETIEKQIMMNNNKKLQQKRNNEADYKK